MRISIFGVVAFFAFLTGAQAQGSAPGSDFFTSPVVKNDQIGVCTHFAFKGNDWPPEKIVPLLVQSGVGWIRDDLPWKTIEKVQGMYEIPSETMNWIDAVSAAGIKIDIVFNYSNRLYPDNYDPQAYAQAAAWVAKRLAGKVQAMEILNEPENFGFSKYYDGEQAWSGLRKDGTVAIYVSKYVTLINTAAPAIRAANRDISIIGLGCFPGANFHALAMGISPAVDGITDHPYSPRSRPELVPFAASPSMLRRDGIFTADEKGTFASQIRMYQAQSAQYKGPKEIWLTEQGWATYHPKKPQLFAGFSEEVQAKYLLRRLAESLGLGVRASFVYDLRDDGTNPNSNEHHFGLLHHDSTPKPSYGAVQRFASAMADFRPTTKPWKVTFTSFETPPPPPPAPTPAPAPAKEAAPAEEAAPAKEAVAPANGATPAEGTAATKEADPAKAPAPANAADPVAQAEAAAAADLAKLDVPPAEGGVAPPAEAPPGAPAVAIDPTPPPPAKTDDIEIYQFADSHGTPLLALWCGARADDAPDPLPGDIEIQAPEAIVRISAFDPLNGTTQDVPFEVEKGGVKLKQFELPDSPLLLTFTMDPYHRVQAQ